jgi:N,N'-diacetyllegionaminate synthase
MRQHVKVIAEVANVHEGDYGYLVELCTELRRIGVDNIKFQYLVPEEFGVPGSENYEEFKRLQITYERFCELCATLGDCNIFFDVFGPHSYKAVRDLKYESKVNVVGVKFHTTDSLNYRLILQAAGEFDQVFISVSGLTAVEISALIRFLDAHGLKERTVLVYGIQNYPTRLENTKINKLSELREAFAVKVCMSDHLDGDLSAAKDVVISCASMGYDFVEKHVTLDRSRRLDDDHSALNIPELGDVLTRLRDVESLFADDVLTLNEAEMLYRNKAKKVLFATKEVREGDIFTGEELAGRRQEGVLSSDFVNYSDLEGKPAARRIAEGERLQLSSARQRVFGLILARSESNRYPGKCYEKIGGLESVRFLIQRIKPARGIDKLVLCTTTGTSDDRLEQIAAEEGISCVRGDEKIHARLMKAFDTLGFPDIFLRLTGDNVFVDHRHIDSAMGGFLDGGFDYYKHEKVIDGCDFEIIKTEAYLSLHDYFENFSENSEYMTLYLKNPYFNIMPPLSYPDCPDFGTYRFTFDYQEDLANIRNACDELRTTDFSYADLCATLKHTGIFTPFSFADKALTIQVKKKVSF